jgi:hypothetical protein
MPKTTVAGGGSNAGDPDTVAPEPAEDDQEPVAEPYRPASKGKHPKAPEAVSGPPAVTGSGGINLPKLGGGNG